jgi:hypothetical protein
MQATTRLHGEVSRLLHCGDGEIPDSLHDDGTVAADLHDDGGPVFVVMPYIGPGAGLSAIGSLLALVAALLLAMVGFTGRVPSGCR